MFFFYNDPSTTDIYTLSLHDALPILRTNNLDQAIAAVDQVVNLSPRFLDAILLRAELHLKKGDAQSVVDSLAAVVKQSPGLLQAELMLAEAYRALGRLDDAIAIVREQIKRAPQNAASYFVR